MYKLRKKAGIRVLFYSFVQLCLMNIAKDRQ